MLQTNDAPMRKVATFALGAFLLAAATGVLLRFGLFQGMPLWAQNFTAVRHAHSHLMYFGWATLAIMAMVWRLLPQWTDEPLPGGVRWQMAATTVVALLSFPAFWSNGYGVTQIGPAALPLGSMVSGLNGLTWIAFALLYARATARLHPRPLPVQLWDWAILLLLLAFCGGLGLVVLVAVESNSLALQQIMLHLFLDLFAAGWFTLALLGLLWGWVGTVQPQSRWLPTQSLAVLLAPTFFLGVSPAFVPEPVFWISALSNAAAALLLMRHLFALWQQRAALPNLARFGLAAMGVHIVIAFVLLWPSLWQWSAGTQLRIFYLHNLLLGWMSSTLLGLAVALWFPLAQSWRRLVQWLWMGGISLMLLALFVLGSSVNLSFIPFSMWMRVAAWSSLLVAMSIGVLAIHAALAGGKAQGSGTMRFATKAALVEHHKAQ